MIVPIGQMFHNVIVRNFGVSYTGNKGFMKHVNFALKLQNVCAKSKKNFMYKIMLEISIEMKKNGEQYYRKVEKTFAINFIRLYVYYKESAKKKNT